MRRDRLTTCHATGVSAGTDPWQKARDTYEAGAVFEGTVRGVNRGGVLVDCWGVSGAQLHTLCQH